MEYKKSYTEKEINNIFCKLKRIEQGYISPMIHPDEYSELQNELRGFITGIKYRQKIIKKLEKENKKMREALEFYGHEDMGLNIFDYIKKDNNSVLSFDTSFFDKARQCLKEIKEGE